MSKGPDVAVLDWISSKRQNRKKIVRYDFFCFCQDKLRHEKSSAQKMSANKKDIKAFMT